MDWTPTPHSKNQDNCEIRESYFHLDMREERITRRPYSLPPIRANLPTTWLLRGRPYEILVDVKSCIIKVLNSPTGQVSEVGPVGQSKCMSETGLD